MNHRIIRVNVRVFEVTILASPVLVSYLKSRTAGLVLKDSCPTCTDLLYGDKLGLRNAHDIA